MNNFAESINNNQLKNSIKQYIKYFKKEWVPKIFHWHVYRKKIRTTHNLERWNREFTNITGKYPVPIKLITKMQMIDLLSTVRINQIKKFKSLNKQKNGLYKKELALFELYNILDNNQVNDEEFLKRIRNIYC